MASRNGRYTIRLSDPSELVGITFGEEARNADKELEVECKAASGDRSASRTRRSSRRKGTTSTFASSRVSTNTRRRKRQEALRLSESSAIFEEVNRIQAASASTSVDKLLSLTSMSLTKFALVGAIQPNDSLKSIYSLARMKLYDRHSASANTHDILSDSSNYPINIELLRQQPTLPNNVVLLDHNVVETVTSPRKRSRPSKAKKSKEVEAAVVEQPVTISILSSDDDDDDDDDDCAEIIAVTKSSRNMAEPESRTALLTDASNNNVSTIDSACLALPDPSPAFEVDEWVLTPVGPGRVESHRIERYSDCLDSLVNPILLYQVALSFGTLHVSSKLVEPFETSSYAKETVLTSIKQHPVTKGDLVRLQPNVYLNDNLVNFYIHHLRQQNCNDKVHVFSSFLYTRIADLCAGKKKNDPDFHSLLWNNLKGWIKNVNLWQLDLLLIPIHDRLHWSVVAVCHPGLLLLADEEDQKMHKQDGVVDCVPCLLHVDSGKRFRLHSSAMVFSRIRSFLTVCLKEQCTMEMTLTKQTLKGCSPPVPAQDNETDCGVFMLEWIERLLANRLVVTKAMVDANGNVPPFGKNAFPQSLIDQKRLDLKTLVYSLSTRTAVANHDD